MRISLKNSSWLQGIVTAAEDYEAVEKGTHRQLYQRRGTGIAAKQGLILVDTKYEFGKAGGKIFLIDEIHTPDSSTIFLQRWLSKSGRSMP